MRVHTDFLNYVTFLGFGDDSRFHPIGTGFLVALKHGGFHHAFVVTAAHVLKGVTKFCIRLNLRAGGSKTTAMTTDVMWIHANPDNDIAVLPLRFEPSGYDLKMMMYERGDLVKAKQDRFDVGHGDIVHAIGLYTSHHGFTKNIPVVRTGNVASLLDEPVMSTEQKYVEGYLIELRTIVGLSGSPVFLMPPEVSVNANGKLERRSKPPTVPLGVLIGYHLVGTKDDQILVSRHPAATASAGGDEEFTLDERNTGFGIVIPFDRVIEILNSDEVWTFMSDSDTEARRLLGELRPG